MPRHRLCKHGGGEDFHVTLSVVEKTPCGKSKQQKEPIAAPAGVEKTSELSNSIAARLLEPYWYEIQYGILIAYFSFIFTL